MLSNSVILKEKESRVNFGGTQFQTAYVFHPSLRAAQNSEKTPFFDFHRLDHNIESHNKSASHICIGNHSFKSLAKANVNVLLEQNSSAVFNIEKSTIIGPYIHQFVSWRVDFEIRPITRYKR